jgi:hypothetical protein
VNATGTLITYPQFPYVEAKNQKKKRSQRRKARKDKEEETLAKHAKLAKAE